MRKAAFWSLRAEAKRIVHAHPLQLVFVSMPVITLSTAKLTETTFIVRAWLLLFRSAWVIWLSWVTIYASILLIAMTALFKEAANRNLFFDIAMQILALVTLAAYLLKPVHADLLLELGLVRQRIERLNYLL